MSTVPYLQLQGLGLAPHKMEKDQHLALCWPVQICHSNPTALVCVLRPAIITIICGTCLKSLPVDIGQVFCGNSFQDTQVQQPPEHTYQWA